jgi:hypothetical protein
LFSILKTPLSLRISFSRKIIISWPKILL